MNKITNFFILFLVIAVLIGIVGIYFYQRDRKEKINECRELCKFQPATEVKESAGRLYQTGGTGAHWYFGESSQRKIFETQEQCLEYCLNQE
ncbi:hypothetical protein KKC63_03165 [Patescibacteria group bacterium]|nr:hypothetical protein [Patescibacteria group bacterium]MBU4023462.1 hypothetical protein [Patescibacteria group bacterium]